MYRAGYNQYIDDLVKNINLKKDIRFQTGYDDETGHDINNETIKTMHRILKDKEEVQLKQLKGVVEDKISLINGKDYLAISMNLVAIILAAFSIIFSFQLKLEDEFKDTRENIKKMVVDTMLEVEKESSSDDAQKIQKNLSTIGEEAINKLEIEETEYIRQYNILMNLLLGLMMLYIVYGMWKEWQNALKKRKLFCILFAINQILES